MQDLSRPVKLPSITAQNKESFTILKGQAVAGHSSGSGIVLANATTNTKNVIGLAAQDILPAMAGQVILDGPFTLSDWTNVAGTVLLAALAVYYLDVTSGKLTTSPPSTPGSVVQVAGRTIAPDTPHLVGHGKHRSTPLPGGWKGYLGASGPLRGGEGPLTFFRSTLPLVLRLGTLT